MARIPIHPGEVLADDLRALNMSAAALARQLNVPTNTGPTSVKYHSCIF